jgi:hypothetical protein
MDLDINNPELIKQLIGALQKLLPDDSSPTEDEPSESAHNIRTKTRKFAKDNKFTNINKFSDMPEKEMHKADTKIDKKLNKYPPTPRNRPFNTVDVVCRTCGKKESVNPKIIPESIDRYKCNKCSSSASK